MPPDSIEFHQLVGKAIALAKGVVEIEELKKVIDGFGAQLNGKIQAVIKSYPFAFGAPTHCNTCDCFFAKVLDEIY